MMKWQTAEVSGIEARYLLFNPEQTQAVIMVHGFRGNAGGLAKIAERLDGFRVIVPDLPGHGGTPPMAAGRHDAQGFARFTAGFAQAVGLERFHLAGHSFGALVAAAVAAEYPSSVDRLVLISPVSESDLAAADIGKAFYALGLGLPEPLGRLLLTSRAASLVSSAILTKTKDPDLRKWIRRHHLEDLRDPYRRRVIAEAVKAVLGKELLGYVPRVLAPTLVITGDRDDLAPAAATRGLMRLMPKAELAVIGDVGHLTHLETPDEMADLMARFLMAT